MLYLPVVLLDGGILDVLLGSGIVHWGGVGRHHRFVLGVTVEILQCEHTHVPLGFDVFHARQEITSSTLNPFKLIHIPYRTRQWMG